MTGKGQNSPGLKLHSSVHSANIAGNPLDSKHRAGWDVTEQNKTLALRELCGTDLYSKQHTALSGACDWRHAKGGQGSSPSSQVQATGKALSEGN